MTKQPPPSPAVQDTHTKPVMTASAIKEIHEIVFKIALPKTEAAKTAKIPVEVLHRLQDLVSTCSVIQDAHPKTHDSMKLEDIGRQLEDLRARLSASDALMPPPQKSTHAPTYAKSSAQCIPKRKEMHLCCRPCGRHPTPRFNHQPKSARHHHHHPSSRPPPSPSPTPCEAFRYHLDPKNA